MRVSPAQLVVLLAILVPFIVQIRTVAGFVGIEVTVTQNAAIGALIILAILVWAMTPRNGPGVTASEGGDR